MTWIYTGPLGDGITYPAFRNYDEEWEFVKNMDTLSEFWLHDAVVVYGQNPQCIGLYLSLPTEISNANSLGAI